MGRDRAGRRTIRKIVHEAARTKTRHLILVTGVPGAGKALVGLQTVHAHYLDDLAVDRGNGKPTAPAVFLSGNGPLVQVLQYELKSAGGDGKTFVRDVKNYVKTYSSNRRKIPPEQFWCTTRPSAPLTRRWYLGDDLIAGPIAELYDWVAANPAPAATGDPFLCETLGIELTGRVATARVREPDHHGVVIDHFHLLKVGERWSIVSKLWDAEP